MGPLQYIRYAERGGFCRTRNYRYARYPTANPRARPITAKMPSQIQNPERLGACSSSPAGLITSYCICRLGRKRNTQLISLPIVQKHNITKSRLAASSARIDLSLAITPPPPTRVIVWAAAAGQRNTGHTTSPLSSCGRGTKARKIAVDRMLDGRVPIYIYQQDGHCLMLITVLLF